MQTFGTLTSIIDELKRILLCGDHHKDEDDSDDDGNNDDDDRYKISFACFLVETKLEFVDLGKPESLLMPYMLRTRSFKEEYQLNASYTKFV